MVIRESSLESGVASRVHYRHRGGGGPMDDETAVATTAGVAQVFDLHALKAFAPDKRVRKMLFSTRIPGRRRPSSSSRARPT
jgi:hypothetical protein